jgi:Fe-S cluster assembly protein SufB
MLRISKLADYATVIMNYLATAPEQIFSAAQIAKHIHVSIPTVSKVLKILQEAGLVVSLRGALGGYKLAMPAEEITLAQIVTAIEGQLAITECNIDANQCMHHSVCTVKSSWQLINKIIFKALASWTLADLKKQSVSK